MKFRIIRVGAPEDFSSSKRTDPSFPVDTGASIEEEGMGRPNCSPIPTQPNEADAFQSSALVTSVSCKVGTSTVQCPA